MAASVRFAITFWRLTALLLFIGTLTAAPAHAQTRLTCPTGSVNLQSGTHYINEPCMIPGDIVLGGTATLVVLQTNLTVDGDIVLSGSARLIVSNATLALDNHYVFDHEITSRGNAQMHVIGSIIKTNVSSPGHSLASQYLGQDQSILYVQNSGVLMPDSWLLGDLRGNAAVHVTQSNFPSEIYPHDNATVILEGATTNSRVWLEFLNGSESLIDRLPNESVPFDWSFGRNTPGVTNIGYQVEIMQAIPTIGISSHPGSRVTLRDTQAALAIGYFLRDLASPQEIVGVGPFTRDIALEHQARLFELDNANVFEFAWQIYVENPTVLQPEPVHVRDSMVNEIAALYRGRIAVDACNLQWAVIAAVGPGSTIEIADSTINSQSIIASYDGSIHIDSSEIFGSLVEATDDASVLFTNVRFSPNICHALCLPACASTHIGGASRCNPFNPAGGNSVFRAVDSATIAAVGLRSIDTPTTVGNALDLRGDLFVFTGSEIERTYTYTLRYQKIGASNTGTIVANGQGPKRDESLGILATSALPAGDYAAILELHIDGEPPVVVSRGFRLVP
jgi:hypothetical protein